MKRRQRKKGEGGLHRRKRRRSVIRAYTPESQSVWTLPTKSIKNSLGQYSRERLESETQGEEDRGKGE